MEETNGWGTQGVGRLCRRRFIYLRGVLVSDVWSSSLFSDTSLVHLQPFCDTRAQVIVVGGSVLVFGGHLPGLRVCGRRRLGPPPT